MDTDIAYIYESPDGGETIYRRQRGDTERELISVSDKKLQEQRLNALWLRWMPILRASADDAVLRKMIEQAESYYLLKQP